MNSKFVMNLANTIGDKYKKMTNEELRNHWDTHNSNTGYNNAVIEISDFITNFISKHEHWNTIILNKLIVDIKGFKK